MNNEPINEKKPTSPLLIVICVLGAFAFMIAIAGFLSITPTASVTTLQATDETAIEEMRVEIRDLRETIKNLQVLIELLLANQANHPQAEPAPLPTHAPLPTQTPSVNQSSDRNNRPTNPIITRERAIEIAQAELATHGLTGTLRSAVMDWEKNQWVWEVDLRTNSTNRHQRNFEIYINVDTGEIIKTEFDD